ncbi:MAG TPA: glycosyltransferase [Tepidisphaeraceae bacterium]|jgi:GT2 family glycosyltransferase|nr:glycosyltransferase [Tepidisphaeraceae bacterium]
MYDLSIVLPTCNRADLLQRSLAAIARKTECEFEIIVVDGASTDHTTHVLRDAKLQLGDRLRILREEKREGFVRATNRGFRAATGRNLIWLNDDACPIGDSLDRAVQQIDSSPADVGFIAMFHRWNAKWNIAHEIEREGRSFQLCHVRGTLYANFPMAKRATFEQLDYFDERYYVRAADPDLSLKAWHAGLRVVPAWESAIDHDEVDDDRRAADSNFGSEDNRKLFEKWDLPPRNPGFNDFNPEMPCTLRGLRTISIAA